MNIMISSEYLTILACPACKGALTQNTDGNSLLCVSCGLSYPVRDGIPVMLPDEAEMLQDNEPEVATL